MKEIPLKRGSFFSNLDIVLLYSNLPAITLIHSVVKHFLKFGAINTLRLLVYTSAHLKMFELNLGEVEFVYDSIMKSASIVMGKNFVPLTVQQSFLG